MLDTHQTDAHMHTQTHPCTCTDTSTHHTDANIHTHTHTHASHRHTHTHHTDTHRHRHTHTDTHTRSLDSYLAYKTNYQPVPIIDQFVRNAKDVSYIVQPLIYSYVCDRIRFLTRGVEWRARLNVAEWRCREVGSRVTHRVNTVEQSNAVERLVSSDAAGGHHVFLPCHFAL